MIPNPRLQSELDPGEQVLWQGAPAPGRLAQRNGCQSVMGGFFVLFSLAWMGGAFFITSIMSQVSGLGAISLFPLFGLIFFGVGLALLFSPLIAARKAAGTLYAVTNRRLIVLEPRGVKSYAPRDIQQLERRGDDDGRSDLIFARRRHQNSDGGSHTEEAGFFGIPDARQVERLIRQHLRP